MRICKNSDGVGRCTALGGYCVEGPCKEEEIIEVEPVRRGQWKKNKNEKKCSECEFIYYSNNDEWNYCPNCGAKMGKW